MRAKAVVGRGNPGRVAGSMIVRPGIIRISARSSMA